MNKKELKEYCLDYTLDKMLSTGDKRIHQKLIVAGSRKFNDSKVVFKALDAIVKKFDKVTIISGEAHGPDSIAIAYYLNKKKAKLDDGLSLMKFPAKWDEIEGIHKKFLKKNKHGWYNPRAGMIRNNQMLGEANSLIAFWDGKSTGTKNMIDIGLDCPNMKHVVVIPV